jgi:hypothetical protein
LQMMNKGFFSFYHGNADQLTKGQAVVSRI